LQRALTSAVIALITSSVIVSALSEHQDGASVETAPLDSISPRHVRADAITRWNQLAHDIAFAEDQFLTFKGQRALAMMHLAMHDVLNSIVPVYERYAYTGPRRVPADPLAAVAQGAYEVLISEYPDQQSKLAGELAAWLARVPPGRLRDHGVELGRAAAAAIVNIRASDGWNTPGEYEFRTGPGQYQTTPPWNGFVASPGFRFAKPFVSGPEKPLRPAPPPPLRSAAYARAFREVKEYGALNSASRTEEQTNSAIWWMEFAEGSVNRLARKLTADRNLHLWSAARLFAHIGMALFDGYVAVWDAKYEFNHWRPYTAIRAADTDGNPRTTPDESWEPLRPTPPFPEYVSAHATACAASFGILEQSFGGNVPFTMETTTAPPQMPTRSFAGFGDATLECANSRVNLGFHFRYSTDAGVVLGRNIARQTLRRSLQPLGTRH
jgi:hypothetical protein